MPKKRRFRFENMWLKEDDCRQIVKNGWEDAGQSEIMDKITFCGLKLQEWGMGVNNKYRGKIKECRERLRKLRAGRDEYGIRSYNEVR